MNAYKLEYDESDYDDWLDETYGDKWGKIAVCGYNYSASRLLYEIDPTAYRCGFSDWESEQDEVWICGNCNERFDDEVDAKNCCKKETYVVTYRANYHSSPETIKEFDDEEEANEFLRNYIKEFLNQKEKDGFDTNKIIEDGAWDLENDTEFNYDLGTWSVEAVND